MMYTDQHSQNLIASRYQILGELGAGSMGKVYRVLDRLNGQEVALKQVLVDKALPNLAQDSQEQQNLRLILANEFQSLASLRHPHIISVLDYGFYDGKHPYFTMNLLKNPQPMTDAGRDKSVQTKTNFLIQMLQALAYIHRRGLLHRDLKPSNILCEDDSIYILDFGLAMKQDASNSGETVGTLAYIAPEVLLGKPASPASDLYAVGLMAYELLAGRYPFQLTDTMQLIYDITDGSIDMSVLDVDDAIQDILSRLLAKSPADRFPNAQAALRALSNTLGLPNIIETEAIRESYLQASNFIGREAERKTLIDALTALTKSQQGTAWLIGGESGVGKSRLVDEIRTQALVSGAMVLSGQAISEGGLAYQVWRSPLRRLALTVSLSPDEACILKFIIPDIADLVGYTVDDPLETNDDARRRLMQVIEQVLVRSAQKQPLVLILEDLQWATESLSLLQTVIQLITDTPMMILATYRDDERPDLPDDFPAMQTISLARLTDNEIARLTTSMIGTTGEQPHVIQLLQKETEGNIFFLVEVIRALAEDAGSLNEIGQTTLPPQVFAGGIDEVIKRRLERMPAWAHPFMNLVAVAGRQLDPILINHLLEQNPNILQDSDVAHRKHSYDDWLTMCNYATILEAQDGQWRFVHDKLREGVINNISADSLPAIHRKVAEAIEAVYAEQVDDYAYILAQHWGKAGDNIKEGHYAFVASKMMDGLNDFREMRRLLNRAFDLKAYKHASNPRQTLADMTQHMGRTLYVFSEYEEAEQYHQEALDMYKILDDKLGIADAIGALGEIKLHQSKHDEAITLIEDSLERYRALNDDVKVGNAYNRLGIIQANMGNLDSSEDYFKKSYEIVKARGEKLSIARLLLNLAILYDQLGEYDKAIDHHEQSKAITEELHDRRGMGFSLLNMAALAQSQGDLEKAHKWIKEGLHYLRMVGEARPTSMALNILGEIELKTNNYQEAYKAYRESLMMRRQSKNVPDLVQSLTNLAKLQVAQGDFGSSYHYYREALQLAIGDDNAQQQQVAVSQIAEMLTQADNNQLALTYLYFIKYNPDLFGELNKQGTILEKMETLEFMLRAKDIETAIQDAQKMTFDDVFALLADSDPKA